MDRIEIHKHERARFHTDRGSFDVRLDTFDGEGVLRISVINGTVTVHPIAANVISVQIYDPHRDAAMIAGIVKRNKERETVSMAFSDMPPGA